MPKHLDKKVVESVLAGTSNPSELRECFQFCCALAIPLVEYRIVIGKIRPLLLGRSAKDIAHDCIADLFVPNHERKLVKISRFIAHCHPEIAMVSNEELTRTFRRLIVSKVNQELPRILYEVDPVLGDILRNIRLGLLRTRLFYMKPWFNQKYLVPQDADTLDACPPLPEEVLEQQILQVGSKKDSIPQLLRKLHTIVTGQDRCKRMVSLVFVALVFKKIITSEEADPETISDMAGHSLSVENLRTVLERALHTVQHKSREMYLASGKRTETEITAYLNTVRDWFLNHIAPETESDNTLCELLKHHLPGTTLDTYKLRHKSVIEYLIRLTKHELKDLQDELE